MDHEKQARKSPKRPLHPKVAARSERMIMVAFAAIMVPTVMAVFLSILNADYPELELVVWIAMVHTLNLGLGLFAGFHAYRMTKAFGVAPWLAAIRGVLMLIPFVNVLVLCILMSSSSKKFKQLGVKNRLLGVSKRDLDRLPELACGKCQYSLDDIRSDRCPECGRRIKGRFGSVEPDLPAMGHAQPALS